MKMKNIIIIYKRYKRKISLIENKVNNLKRSLKKLKIMLKSLQLKLKNIQIQSRTIIKTITKENYVFIIHEILNFK